MRRDDFNEFDPFRIMRRIEKQFSNMGGIQGFDNFRSDVREPLVDMSETQESIKIIIELPGVDKKDIDLRVKERALVIRSTIKRNTQKKEEDTLYSERQYKQYHRVVPLPEYANTKEVNAKYNNGILEIIIPKLENKKKDTSRIEVK